MKKQKGITLIALVVTIIVLLILAGVTIGFLSGEDGLISRIIKSIDTGKIADYKEAIELNRSVAEILAGTKDMTDKEYMDNFENDLRKDAENGNLKGSSVKRKDDGTVRVVTPDGHVFDATREEINYIGKNVIPDASEITIIPSTTNWTNEDVTFTITTAADTDEFKLQYATSESGPWTDLGVGTPTLTENGTMYARFVDKTDETNVSGNASSTISNIDTTPPIINSDLSGTVKGTTSISLSTKVTDSNSGLGKIEWHYGSSSTTSTYQASAGSTGTTTQITKSTTLTGLSDDTTYQCYAIVYDVAGNSTRTPAEDDYLSLTTDLAIPSKSAISISPSTNTWINSSYRYLKIETTADPSKWTLLWSRGSGAFKQWEGSYSFFGSETFRIKLQNVNDPTIMSEEVEAAYTRTDYVAPKVTMNSYTVVGHDATVEFTATDDLSGIKWVQLLLTSYPNPDPSGISIRDAKAYHTTNYTDLTKTGPLTCSGKLTVTYDANYYTKHCLSLYATDKAGNDSEKVIKNITMSKL